MTSMYALITEANAAAVAQVERERFQEAVEREKTRIRAGKWWHKFVPFVVRIERRKAS